MVKLTTLSSSLAAGLLLLSTATAQLRGVPARPAAPRPAPPPALASQPLVDTSGQVKQAVAKVTVKPRKAPPKVDPATKGVKIGGRDLKRAVAKLKKMPWRKSMRECQLEAKSTGKPILWLQTLGDLTGYA